jgi:hypothetical protein
MRRVVSTISLALLAVAVLGATGGTLQAPSMPPQPSVTLPPDLARVLTDYEGAWSARDAAALARLFADNRVVVPNACPPVKGRAAVQRATRVRAVLCRCAPWRLAPTGRSVTLSAPTPNRRVSPTAGSSR